MCIVALMREDLSWKALEDIVLAGKEMMTESVAITDDVVIVNEEECFEGPMLCLYTTSLIAAPELSQYQDPCPECSGILCTA